MTNDREFVLSRFPGAICFIEYVIYFDEINCTKGLESAGLAWANAAKRIREQEAKESTE